GAPAHGEVYPSPTKRATRLTRYERGQRPCPIPNARELQISTLADDHALAGRQFQHRIAALGEPLDLGGLLLVVGEPTEVVENDDPAGRHALEEGLQRADLRLDVVHVHVQESDLLRRIGQA